MKPIELIKVDKRSNYPIFQQLFMSIFYLILNRQLEHYQSLPSIERLSKHLSIDQKEVDQAYQLLVDNHFIDKGDKGYFVSYVEISSDLFAKNSTLSESILKSGKKPSNKLISAKKIKGTPDIYGRSNFDKTESLFEIKRIFFADNIPVFIVTTYISLARLPKLDEYYNEETPIYQIYKEKYNIDYSDSHRHIKVIALSAKDAKIFNDVPGTATFLTTYYFSDQHARQIGYAEIITSSHFAFTIDIDI